MKVVVINYGFRCLNVEFVLTIEAPFLKFEVCEIVKECDGNKALGPDGFNLNFFKTSWLVLKREVMDLIYEFYNNGHLGNVVNEKNPNFVGDSKPISLVGSINKLVAKLLANILRKVIVE
ncbi:hypothetical protein SCA6_000737, partial [Theobroma cacao]